MSKSRQPETMAATDPSRARGALLGLAVGDALGTTLEFTHPGPFPFEPLLDGPHRDIKGGGPFNVAPGQVTDDTQMACCLADSLRERDELDLRDLAARYVEWRRHAFDIGNQTASAINHLASLGEHETPTSAGRRVWENASRPPAGNGSLMRTAPIGVFFATDPDARLRASLDESALTHFDPRCQLACAAFNAAIAEAITSPNATAESLIAAADGDLRRGADLLPDAYPDLKAEVDQARAALLADLEAAQKPDPDLYGSVLHLLDHEGFVRVAFRLAFWHLHHAPTFEAALIDTANRGGDADTNAAITGALLGAAHGESAIPERWKTTVLHALQDGPAAPLRDHYHPRGFLGLA